MRKRKCLEQSNNNNEQRRKDPTSSAQDSIRIRKGDSMKEPHVIRLCNRTFVAHRI